jgi:hypothetical protein
MSKIDKREGGRGGLMFFIGGYICTPKTFYKNNSDLSVKLDQAQRMR